VKLLTLRHEHTDVAIIRLVYWNADK